MKIIVPCAGRSSRYPGVAPKWMLPTPNGSLMVRECLSGMAWQKYEVILAVLEEHLTKYNILETVEQVFESPVKIHRLPHRTNSPSETIASTLLSGKIAPREAIFIKDVDSAFNFDLRDGNYVCVSKVSEHQELDKKNKGYVGVDPYGQLNEIREKEVFSDTFCVGGYGFRQSKDFLDAFHYLQRKSKEELHVSRLIAYLLNQGHSFFSHTVKHYQDWGTLKEWETYHRRCEAVAEAIPRQSYER